MANELISNNEQSSDETMRANWIPIAERMPEEGVEVLALIPLTLQFDDCDPRENFCYEVGTYGLHESGKWALDGRSDGSKVTHWMPLPAPPDGGTF